jgi:hypothetical protein
MANSVKVFRPAQLLWSRVGGLEVILLGTTSVAFLK